MKQNLPILKKIKIVWIAASLALLAITNVTQAETLKVTYGLYAGGFNVVDIAGTYTITGTTYDLNMDLKTNGLLGKLAPWSGVISSSGQYQKESALPHKHSFASTWRGETETTIFTFGKDGVLNSHKLIEGDGTIKDKMPDEDVYQDKPTDMLSALFKTMNASSCETTQPALDGKRRFDMVFRSHGTDSLTQNRYNVFEGEAEICEIEIVPVAGKWREKPRGWMSIQGQAKGKGQLPRLLFGKVRDDMPPIPVRFFIKTNYGAMVMHLKNIE